jgi:hypothetical protein
MHITFLWLKNKFSKPSKKNLLGLLFDPEEGGSIFFQNVVELLADYTASGKCLTKIPFLFPAASWLMLA